MDAAGAATVWGVDKREPIAAFTVSAECARRIAFGGARVHAELPPTDAEVGRGGASLSLA